MSGGAAEAPIPVAEPAAEPLRRTIEQRRRLAEVERKLLLSAYNTHADDQVIALVTQVRGRGGRRTCRIGAVLAALLVDIKRLTA